MKGLSFGFIQIESRQCEVFADSGLAGVKR